MSGKQLHINVKTALSTCTCSTGIQDRGGEGGRQREEKREGRKEGAWQQEKAKRDVRKEGRVESEGHAGSWSDQAYQAFSTGHG